MRASGKPNIGDAASSLASFRLTLSIAICMIVLIAVGRSVASVDSVATTSPTPLAHLSESVSVHARGRGNPSINLSDGREVLTSYSGPDELTQALQRNDAEPLALASSDFDEDGVPDLISGYGHSGSGIITWLRGNVDSIYQNSPEAQQRKAAGEFTEAPFLSPARVFGLPIKPEFLGTGDFDADGHWDIVAASRISDALYLLSGDGNGGFKEPRRIALPGPVTAFVTGEINRRDGLDDVIVAINGKDGPKVLVFEGSEGALKARPEVFDLPAEASALGLGQMDDDYPIDLAVAAGNELVIISGRDRELSFDEKFRPRVPQASIIHRALGSRVRSMSVGRFSGNRKDQLALLLEDGSVRLVNEVRRYAEAEEPIMSRRPAASALVCATIPGIRRDDLVLIDPQDDQLHIVMPGRLASPLASTAGAMLKQQAVSEATLDVQSEPVAVLPMRLNMHARYGLVILSSGHSSPSVVLPQSSMTFTVNTADDHDGVCDSGDCTLREAMRAAADNIEADTIIFNIPGPSPHTITLKQQLPNIGNDSPNLPPGGPLTIDGTTQPGFSGKPVIELRGAGGFGLSVGHSADGSVIRGLVISGFEFGIFSVGASIVVEGNFIGTDSNGASAIGGPIGIRVFDAAGVIGGTAPQARNVIAGDVSFSRSNSGRLLTNYIGTDVNGVNALGGGEVGLTETRDFEISNNVIANGVSSEESYSNIIQNNVIGTDAAGTAAMHNLRDGIYLRAPGDGNTIVGNIISGNGGNGIFIDGPSNSNLIVENRIGTDASGTQPLPNLGNGILIQEESASNIVEMNRIGFNKKSGVRSPFNTDEFRPEPVFNRVLVNSIFSNGELGIDLGNAGESPNDDQDFDAGPNELQNFPALKHASTDGSSITVEGGFNSTPNESFTIEFFSTPNDAGSELQASAFGACVPQGQIFLGSIKVTTDRKGNVPISIAFPSGNPGGFINATATSLAGNTSEFSACVQLKFPNADISVEQTAVASVAPGSSLRYQVTVANNGPDLATNIVLISRIPDTTTFESFTAPGGWLSRVPDRGGTGAITSGVAGLYPGTSATFTIVLNVNANVEDGAIIARSATVSSVIPDLAPGNNSVTANTVVRATTPTIPPDAAADMSISLTGPAEAVFEGNAIIYVLMVTNSGPAAAKDIVVRQAAPNNTTFASSTKAAGWSSDCSTADGTSDIKFCTASLALQASARFTITVTVNRNTAAQTRIEATATVTSKSDPNSDNNSANVTVTTETRPDEPSITSIEIGEAITVRGAGFSKNLAVFIDGVGFSKEAKVKGSTRVVQKGKLIDGRSIAEAVPPGKVVRMKFRNPNGGEIEVSFKN